MTNQERSEGKMQRIVGSVLERPEDARPGFLNLLVLAIPKKGSRLMREPSET
jgi:hypothetical protein